MLREGGYVERNGAAADEFDCYEVSADGTQTGAVTGAHDDRVMTRAIGCYIAYTWPLTPKAPFGCFTDGRGNQGAALSAGGVPLVVVQGVQDAWEEHMGAVLRMARGTRNG
jgi:hypothetical protein